MLFLLCSYCKERHGGKPLLFQAQRLVQSYLRTTWALPRVILRVILSHFLFHSHNRDGKIVSGLMGRIVLFPYQARQKLVRAKVCTAHYLKRGSWEKNEIGTKPQGFLLTNPTISSRMVLRNLASETFSGPPKGLLSVCLLFSWTLLFFSPQEGPAHCCCGPTTTSDAQSRCPVGGTWESPATCDCWHCPHLLPAPTHREFLPGPKAVPEWSDNFLFLCHSGPKCSIGQ